MDVLDRFLELLMDGEWHILTEFPKKLGISGVKVGIIAGFFKYFGFIETDGANARIDARVGEFLKRIKWVERAGCRKAEM